MKFIYAFLLVNITATLAHAQQNTNPPAALAPTVTCDTVIQTSTCAGGNVIVPFTVTGGNFSFGNVFTAQLSNALGQFTAPVNIGSLPWIGSGIILATIPQSTNFGFFYRIRVIASNPSDTSNPSPNPVIITQVAQLNQIVALPHNYVCPGDTITLIAINPATSYSWSTGDTTASIQVTQPGIYSVTTTDPLTCQSTTSDTLYTSCTGVEEKIPDQLLRVFPDPAQDYLMVQLRTEQHMQVDLSLFNVIGERVYRSSALLSGTTEKRIDVTGLPAGIYFLTADSKGGRLVRKVIVQ